MNLEDLTLWAHLVGASIWLGGLFVVASIGVVLQAGGTKRKTLRRAYTAWISTAWVGMFLAIATGIILMAQQDLDWSDSTIALKLALIVAAAMLAVIDGWLIFRTREWVQTALQTLLIVISLGIFGAAVGIN